MQTALSIIALVFSALSLGWQTANYLLTGARVRVEVQIGAADEVESSVLSKNGNGGRLSSLSKYAGQGYTNPLVGVEVRNVGRLPVTVTSWGIRCFPKKVTVRPVDASIGPRLPHRMEVGEVASWYVSADVAARLIASTAETFGVPQGAIKVRGTVSLGNGRSPITRGRGFKL